MPKRVERVRSGPLGEFEIIARYFAPLANHPRGARRSGTTPRSWPSPRGRSSSLTCDTIIEGVHFLAADPPIVDWAQGARRQPLRSRGEGREAPCLSLSPRAAGAARRLRGLKASPKVSATLQEQSGIGLDRRGHHRHPRAFDHHHHGAWSRAARGGGAAPRGASRRPAVCERNHRRCRSRSEAVEGASPRGGLGLVRRRRAICSSSATGARRPEQHWRCRFANTLTLPSTSPTGSPAMRRSSARLLASAPGSRRAPCRSLAWRREGGRAHAGTVGGAAGGRRRL